jgi:transcriptional regulator with XRE-family HTH domain
MSQRQLAEYAGVPASFIGSVELGRAFPGAERLDRIAAALGLQPFQLFLDEDDASIQDRYESLAALADELRERVSGEIDAALRRHLRS